MDHEPVRAHDCAGAIVLVEDDEATRRFLADNLRADGYTVTEAADAASGERELARGYPDLAILDLGLPDRDGLDLIEAVRASDRVASRIDPELPIVVLSGRAGELDRIRGFDHGCDDYIVKPSGISSSTGNTALRRLRPGNAVPPTRSTGSSSAPGSSLADSRQISSNTQGRSASADW